MAIKPKYKVHLCRECIKQLDEDYPYSIPRDELEIIEVPVEECDNEDLDIYNDKLAARNPEYFKEAVR